MNRARILCLSLVALGVAVPMQSALAQPASVVAPASAPSALPDALSTALATALNDRPEMRTAALRSDIARERIRQAAARFYPTVDLLLTAQSNTVYDTFSGVTATGTVQGQTVTVAVARLSPRYTVSPALQLGNDIYTGGRDSALLRNAQAAHQADMLGAEAQTREVMRDVTLAYLHLGQAWHRWRIATRWAEVARSLEKATAGRLVAGRASQLEAETDALARAQRDLDVQTQSQEVAARRAEFLRALGRRSDVSPARPEELGPLLTNFTHELDALEARGIAPDNADAAGPGNEPELLRAHAMSQAARELVNVEKSANLPQVRLLAQYVGAGRSDSSIGSAFTDMRRGTSSVWVTVTHNLFSGFATQSRILEARMNAERMLEEATGVQSRLSLAQQGLAGALAKAEAQFEYAQQRRQVEALRLQVAQARLGAGRAYTEDVEKAHMAVAAADADILDRRIGRVAALVRLKFVSIKDVTAEAKP
ncbi:hypothetical protein B9Z45_13210 [Limnohabitans sp. 2KL-17]|uniref:TolC family protein n=1 Tax=Limnohabitans sp. 2KL-17 TaxID=1100704 RepID=UPI000D35C98D|nr:TolC family protein [Limnohabitans sp. 2KL-17]PUE53051.1 hypothetical protein B9Z45_13210 [Limnohabitans sp. 2KL-17]